MPKLNTLAQEINAIKTDCDYRHRYYKLIAVGGVIGATVSLAAVAVLNKRENEADNSN